MLDYSFIMGMVLYKNCPELHKFRYESCYECSWIYECEYFGCVFPEIEIKE